MLTYARAKSQKELQEIYDHNMSAFFDSDEFEWKMDWIKKQNKEGWDFYSVSFEEEIIAALLIKRKDKTFWSKQTPVKMSFQGNGFSHNIREYIEELANEEEVVEVFNICAIDNFRMVALNESHGYKKTGKKYLNSKTLVEWYKKL